MSQELSISDGGKILKLCDLSDKDNVLWIKTYSVSEKDESKENSLARQLHYESNWRNIFAFFVDVDRHINNKGEFVTDVVKGYNINLEEYEPKPIESVRVLWNDEIKILKIIKNSPSISNANVAREIGRTSNSVGKTIKTLIYLKYIEKDSTKRTSKWILLRDVEDIKIKYSYFKSEIMLLFDDKSESEN